MWSKIKKYSYLIFIKYFGLLIIGLFALDIITKQVMQNVLKTPGSTITIIPNLFEFQLVYNTGSFSGWFGSDVGHILLIIVSFIGAIGLPYLLIKYRNKITLPMNLGIAIVTAGNLGNLIDRLAYVDGKPRGVIDFLHFYIPSINFDWPVFNVADICIVVGVIMFAVFYCIYDYKNEKAKKENKIQVEKVEEIKEDGEKDGE